MWAIILTVVTLEHLKEWSTFQATLNSVIADR